MKLKVNNEIITYDEPISLEEVVATLKLENVLAATVNDRLRELTYLITKDATIEFIGYDSPDAIQMYQATLRYIVAMAVHRIFDDTNIHFNFSISRSILAIFKGLKGTLNQKKLDELQAEVNRIIAADYPIKRRRISIG